MILQDAPAFMAQGVAYVVATFTAIVEDDTVTAVAKKIGDFINENKHWLFNAIVAIQFFTAPMVCLTSFAAGYWVLDKEIIINPGNKQFTPISIIATPNREVACLVVAILLRFFMHPVISTVAFG